MNDFQNSDAAPSIKLNEDWTAERADQWFERREWLNAASFTPHDSINRLEFAARFHAQPARWRKAFEFLRDSDLNALPPGEYPIDGTDVFAIVAEAAKKDFAATKWESHRKYQDIQMVISGGERMGIAPASALVVSEPYDESRDVGFYTGDGTIHRAEPNVFFIFFPSDGHRPDIKIPGIERDKKIVVKVKIN